MEDLASESRMEGRLLRKLKPEFARAVDKKDSARRMEVQFGWREGVHPTLPRADVERDDGTRRLPWEEDGAAEIKRKVDRPVTAWPSALSMFVPPHDSDGVSPLSLNGTNEMPESQPQLYPQQYPVLEKEKKLPFEEHYHVHDASAGRDYPNPFEDTSYPATNYWGSSVYSGPRVVPQNGRKPSPELFMTTEAEAAGPCLIVPFSWPEIPLSSSTDGGLVPPMPLSRRSFLSFSKDQIHVVGRKPLPRAETAPQLIESSTTDFDSQSLEKLEKRATAPSVVGRGSLPLQEALRESRVRVVRTKVERLDKAEASRRKGVAGWLSRLR